MMSCINKMTEYVFMSPLFDRASMSLLHTHSFLSEEVSLHKVTLFSSFRNILCNRNKKELWSNIVRKMAASRSGTPRSWQGVRKKWLDFSRQVKVRGSAVCRDRRGPVQCNP